MTKETKTRVEKHIIKVSDSFFPMLFDFCHKSKNLYNHANYIVRHAFTKEKKRIRYAELDKLLKLDEKYFGKPKLPKYLKKDGNFFLILTNQNCKLKNGKIY